MGKKAAKILKKEAGGHRWQRNPPTESRGRVHTSTITVAVLEERKDVQIEIKESDLEIKTARGSGKGGQHRNKTDSAVQVKHLPTGLIVRCENERSQHQNKDQALSVLKSKLFSIGYKAVQNASNNQRKDQIGSGMRGDKIRTIRVQDNTVVNNKSNKRTTFKDYYKGRIEKVQ